MPIGLEGIQNAERNTGNAAGEPDFKGSLGDDQDRGCDPHESDRPYDSTGVAPIHASGSTFRRKKRIRLSTS